MLLEELANSEGNILENKALIDSLNQTKKQSTEIESALEESKKL
jgi:dynein heavy chain 2